MKVDLGAVSSISLQSNNKRSAKFDFTVSYRVEHKKGWQKLNDGFICYNKDGELVHCEQRIDGDLHFCDPKTGEIIY